MVSEHIEQREGVYYIPGTRISLDSIVYAFREGCSPESIRGFRGARLYRTSTVPSPSIWITRPISTLITATQGAVGRVGARGQSCKPRLASSA